MRSRRRSYPCLGAHSLRPKPGRDVKTTMIVETAEDAIMLADDFLSRYYVWKHPLTARNDGDSWTVLFDVGSVTTRKIEMKVDCASGKILEFVGLDYMESADGQVPDGEGSSS